MSERVWRSVDSYGVRWLSRRDYPEDTPGTWYAEEDARLLEACIEAARNLVLEEAVNEAFARALVLLQNRLALLDGGRRRAS